MEGVISVAMNPYIDAALEKMGERSILLLHLTPEGYLDMMEKSHIKRLLERNGPILYITASKTSEKLLEGVAEGDRDMVFFIDMATGSGSDISVRRGNTLFIASPRELTELGIALCTSSNVFGERKRTVILDNISTLLVENDERSVEKFMHFLVAKMRGFGDRGVLIHVGDKKDERMVSAISQFCDMTLRLDKLR